MVFIYICLAIQFLNVCFLIRSELVFRYRMKLLDSIRDIARPDVAIRMIELLAAVTYGEMVIKFWRPFNSFYPEEVIKLLE